MDVAWLLIEHGADVAAQSKEGMMTTLHWVSEWGHVDIARLLIKHSANMAAQNKHRRIR